MKKHKQFITYFIFFLIASTSFGNKSCSCGEILYYLKVKVRNNTNEVINYSIQASMSNSTRHDYIINPLEEDMKFDVRADNLDVKPSEVIKYLIISDSTSGEIFNLRDSDLDTTLVLEEKNSDG